jgi:hypothetical protein
MRLWLQGNPVRFLSVQLYTPRKHASLSSGRAAIGANLLAAIIPFILGAGK